MIENGPQGWTFLSKHGQALVCIARDPGIRLREIGECVGITERAAHRIVSELATAGYITRERDGRRNRYTVSTNRPLPERIASEHNIGTLLKILAAPQRAGQRARRVAHEGD